MILFVDVRNTSHFPLFPTPIIFNNYNMKPFLSFFIIGLLAHAMMAQDKPTSGFQFTTIYDLPTTSVKDQNQSGTCWSFSTISFIESEMMRMGKDSADLSEMFVVRHCYHEKADKYVRMHGAINFGAGGAFHDVMHVFETYGMVPEAEYKGLNYGSNSHVHGEFDNVLKGYVDQVIKCTDKKLTSAWLRGYDGILDAYLGALPTSFTYESKSYTPQSFAKERIGINPADYIEISSFTHHPFYSSFQIEIPDNWMWSSVYNVPMNDMTTIVQNALKKGYTVAWGADVSEKGFSFRNGVAIVPEADAKAFEGTERAKWESASEKDREKMLYSFEKPMKEKVITQEMRQQMFDNYETTDDHGMHIIGMVKDQNGTLYYKVKNSWNTDNVYKGYFYVSESFFLAKTTSIMIHKDAMPKEIAKKLSL